jgi:hypothetical protein
MVGSFLASCARAPSGHAAAAPPSSVMNSRRFMSSMGFPIGPKPSDIAGYRHSGCRGRTGESLGQT